MLANMRARVHNAATRGETMTVVDGDVVYKVWWDHREAPKKTKCRIRMGRADFTPEQWDAAPEVFATALLNDREDRYCRNKGRKVSLSRVLALTRNSEVFCFSTPTRALIWSAYRAQLGHW